MNYRRRTPWISRLLTTASLVLLVVGTAACGASSQTGGATPGGGSNAATTAAGSTSAGGKVAVPEDFCSLLSASEISGVVGQSMPAPQPDVGTRRQQNCVSRAPGTAVGDVFFSEFMGHSCFLDEAPSAACLSETAEMFAVAKKQAESRNAGPVQAVADLGSQAYCAVDNRVVQSASVEVLRDWLLVSVDSDSCAHSEALARLLLSKL